jgi:hypothetical protein
MYNDCNDAILGFFYDCIFAQTAAIPLSPETISLSYLTDNQGFMASYLSVGTSFAYLLQSRGFQKKMRQSRAYKIPDHVTEIILDSISDGVFTVDHE